MYSEKAEELDVMMGHSPYDFIRVGGFLSGKMIKEVFTVFINILICMPCAAVYKPYMFRMKIWRQLY